MVDETTFLKFNSPVKLASGKELDGLQECYNSFNDEIECKYDKFLVSDSRSLDRVINLDFPQGKKIEVKSLIQKLGLDYKLDEISAIELTSMDRHECVLFSVYPVYTVPYEFIDQLIFHKSSRF